MFSATNIIPDVDVKDIFEVCSEYDIFKKYCKNFEEINKPFLSEFYNDTSPDCRIFQSKDNSLLYKDFGEPNHCFNCFTYVMYKFKYTFKEALNVISIDFGIINSKTTIKPNFIIGRENTVKKQYFKPVISIVSRPWNLTDYKYWFKQYGISFEWLDSYDVIPCEYVYLTKESGTISFKSTPDNPIYAYRFEENGKYVYKIYRPLADKNNKWLFSGSADCIEGFNQLPLFDDILILTKSLKDVICCRLCGYSAISLQGEANPLKREFYEKLKKRFTNIIVFYDNDDAGKKASENICKIYNLKSIEIPEKYKSKDLSELISKIGLEESNIILKTLIDDTIKG
jgi:5S rRNA maturation endonuclease (ribonuclease M5)